MLDLNKPGDFAKAVSGPLGATAGVLSLFAQRQADWQIEEASYISNSSLKVGKRPIVFHVFKTNQPWTGSVSDISDSGGRRKITYMFPYQDGATNDDLGRSPENFSINVIFHGNNYLSLYKQLFLELNKPDTGVLVHPVRGPIECVMKEFTITHKSDTRKAMTVSLLFVENTFSLGHLNTLSNDPTVKTALAQALQIFKDIDTAITNIRGALIFVKQVRDSIAAALTTYKNAYASLLNSMNRTFNGSLASNDLPGLMPLNQGGLQNEKGEMIGDTFSTVISPNDPFKNVPLEQLETGIIDPVAISQLERQVQAQREYVSEIFELYRSDPMGEVIYHDDIVNLKVTLVAMQEVLETGKSSSHLDIKEYIVPRIMSLRECAFLNGVPLNRLNQLELYNHGLLSVNHIEKGTKVRIPV